MDQWKRPLLQVPSWYRDAPRTLVRYRLLLWEWIPCMGKGVCWRFVRRILPFSHVAVLPSISCSSAFLQEWEWHAALCPQRGPFPSRRTVCHWPPAVVRGCLSYGQLASVCFGACDGASSCAWCAWPVHQYHRPWSLTRHMSTGSLALLLAVRLRLANALSWACHGR